MRGIVAVFWFLCCCHIVHAASSISPEGFLIVSDQTTVDFKNGITSYDGDVRITKTGINFTADFVREHREAGKIKELKAIGTPIVYVNNLETNKGIFQGKAVELEYSRDAEKITLINFELTDTLGNTYRGKNGVYLLEE